MSNNRYLNLFGQLEKLPKKRETAHSRLTSYYCRWWYVEFEGKCNVSFGRFNAVWKKLLTEYSEEQVRFLIFIHFHWYGIEDNNDLIHKNLISWGFPVNSLLKNSSIYKTFIVNTLRINFDSMIDVNAYLKQVDQKLSTD